MSEAMLEKAEWQSLRPAEAQTTVETRIREQSAAYKKAGIEVLVVNIPQTSPYWMAPFVESLLSMVAGEIYNNLLRKFKVKLYLNLDTNFPIDYNRNNAMTKALEVFDADYIMQFDTDMTFDIDTIPALLEAIKAPSPDGDQVEIVSGIYFLKHPPFRPVLGLYTSWEKEMLVNEAFLRGHGFVCGGECKDPRHAAGTHQLMRFQAPHFWPSEKLFRADVIGVGCVLSRASMWRKLSYPYYRYGPNPIHGPARNGAAEVSEDMYWCAQMHRAGIKVWVHPSVECVHLGVMKVSGSMYRGHFSAAQARIRALPEGHPEKKLFMDNVLDLR